MDIADLDRDVAVPRNAAADHAPRWLRGPSPNSISGPSNWVITLTDHAAENPEFLASLERAMASSSRESQELPPSERAPLVKKATGPNLLEILHAGGETALQDAVNGLATDQLIKLVVQEGVRKMKDAKSLGRSELIDLLQEMARNRLRQGESFVRGGA